MSEAVTPEMKTPRKRLSLSSNSEDGSVSTKLCGTGGSCESESSFSTSGTEDSDEYDSVVVCEDWTAGVGTMDQTCFDSTTPNSNNIRCDQSMDTYKISMMPLLGMSDGEDMDFILIPRSQYIANNLELFYAMCNIEDLGFVGMEVAEQEQLMKTVAVERYVPGQHIMTHNEPGDDFFFVITTATDVDGLAPVEVYRDGKVVTRLPCGSLFGEKQFLTRLSSWRRTATVRIVSEFNPYHMGALVLEKGNDQEKDGDCCIKAVPVTREREKNEECVIEVGRVRQQSFQAWGALRENIIAKTIPPFGALSRDALSRIIGLMKEEHFTSGEFIMRQGEYGTRLYFILEGKVNIVRTDAGQSKCYRIAKLHPGHCFGEMAVLSGDVRTASALTSEQTTCLTLTRETYLQACRMDPALADFVKGILHKRQEIQKKRNEVYRPRSPSTSHVPSMNALASLPGATWGGTTADYSSACPNDTNSNHKSNDSKSHENSSRDYAKENKKPHSTQTVGGVMTSSRTGAGTTDIVSSLISSSPPPLPPSLSALSSLSGFSNNKEKEGKRWMQCSPPKSGVREEANTQRPLNYSLLFNTPQGTGGWSKKDPPVTITKCLTSSKTPLGERVLNGKYVVKKRIGQGTFGEVFMVVDSVDNVYAMKCLRRSRINKADSKDAEKVIQSEITIMSKLRHPNIVALYEVIDDIRHSKIFLVQEYMEHPLMPMCDGGEGGEPLDPEQALSLFRDIVRGVSYLHSCSVVHRDIKPQNIFVSASGVAKIGDFGASVYTGGLEKSAYQGTPAFTAPELSIPKEFCKENFSIMPCVDIFAMGATLFYMVTGKLPWTARTQVSLAARIRNVEPRFPQGMDLHLKHVLQRMLDKNYATRITIRELEKDDWLTSEGSEPLYSYQYSSDEETLPLDLVVTELKMGESELLQELIREEELAAKVKAVMLTKQALHIEMILSGDQVECTQHDQTQQQHRNAVANKLAKRVVLVRDEEVLALLSGAHSKRKILPTLLRSAKATRLSLEAQVFAVSQDPECALPGKPTMMVHTKPPSPAGSIYWKQKHSSGEPSANTSSPPSYAIHTPERVQTFRVSSPEGRWRGPAGADEYATEQYDDSEEEDSDEFETEEIRVLSLNSIDDEFTSMMPTVEKELDQVRALAVDEKDWNRVLPYPDGLPASFSHLKTKPQGSFYGKVAPLKLTSARNENLKLGLRVGVGLDQGNRPYMEDFVVCHCTLPVSQSSAVAAQQTCVRVVEDDMALIAVFDGHGDKGETSRKLAHSTEDTFLDILEVVEGGSFSLCDGSDGDGCGGSGDSGNESSDSTSNTAAAKKNENVLLETVSRLAFETLFDLHKLAQDSSTTERYAKKVFSTTNGGSTALLLTICRDAASGRLILTGANVGDSRVVLSRRGIAVLLNSEHRTSNLQERERVLAASGVISENGRIYGDIELTRSLGDIRHKGIAIDILKRTVPLDNNEPSNSGNNNLSVSADKAADIMRKIWASNCVITSKPEVWSTEIDPETGEGDEFLVAGTDGLFDHVSAQEAINFVRRDLLRNPSLETAAKNLASLAIQRAGRSADNIGIAIIAFGQL